MLRSLIAVFVIACAGLAQADTQPWRTNVSPAQMERAKALLDEGNALFADNKVVEALAKYRLALGEWNHPAIHFNAVRCLIQLDRRLEAAESIEQALKYGADPLNPEVYREALNYQRLLQKQIGDLEISCTQPGVVLTLDGQPLAPCPGKVASRVLPGRHQVVGKKAGFVTQTVDIVVAGADRQRVPVELAIATGTRVVHRWPAWLPWTVFVGGLAVGAGGLGAQLGAISAMNDYDALVVSDCQAGCSGNQQKLRDLEDTARTRNVVGVALISVGAATAITGGVMLYLNRGKTVRETEKRVVVVPLDGGAAMAVGGRF